MSSKESYFSNIFHLAQELQQKESLTDVFLQPKEVAHKEPLSGQNLGGLLLTKFGYPAHQLLLAGASPFFKQLFEEHYADHKDTIITVMLPEASAHALQCVLVFIYTSNLSVPPNLYEEVLKLSISLKITSLSNALDPKKTCFGYKEVDSFFLTRRYGRMADARSWTKGRLPKISSDASKRINSHNEKVVKLVYKSEAYKDSYSSGLGYGKNLNTKFNETSNLASLHEDAKRMEKKRVYEGHIDSHGVNSKKNIIATTNAMLHDSGVNILINSAQSNNASILTPKPEPKTGKLFLISTGHDFVNKNPNLVLNLCPLERSVVTPMNPGNKVASSCVYTSGYTPTSNSISASFPATSDYRSSDQGLVGSQNNFYSLLQSEMPSASFGASDLEPNEEEEEKLLKLQVLLKDCEGVDLRGSNIYEAQGTPTREQNLEEKFFQPSPEHVSADDWIASDVLEGNLKEVKETEYSNDAEKLSHNPPIMQPDDIKSSETKFDLSNKDNNAKMNLKCQFCSKCFLEIKDLQHHLRVAHQKMGIVCHICGRFFTKKSDLIFHQSRHKKPTLPCPICGKLFKLNKDLAAHRETHGRQLTFECAECGKLLTSKRNLQLHIAGVHKRLKPFKCGECEKKYTKKVDLLKHIRKIHTGERPYQCDKCEESFHSSGSLYYHKDVHLTDANFSCKICSKSFKTRIGLIYHKRAHTLKLKSVKCQGVLCKEDSTDGAGIKSIKCRFCRGSFNSAEQFENHMQSYHGTDVKLSKIKVKQVAIPVSIAKAAKKTETLSNLQSKDIAPEQSITVIPLESSPGHLLPLDDLVSKDGNDLEVISTSTSSHPGKAVHTVHCKKNTLPHTGVRTNDRQSLSLTRIDLADFSCPVNLNPPPSLSLGKTNPLPSEGKSKIEGSSKHLAFINHDREFGVHSPSAAEDFHIVHSFNGRTSTGDSSFKTPKRDSFVDNFSSKLTSCVNVEKFFQDISAYDLVDSFKT